LDATGVSDLGPSGVTTHVNKVHHVTTIARVAERLGEDEDWLHDVANEMEIEDSVIWVYGVGEDGVLAFHKLRPRERFVTGSISAIVNATIGAVLLLLIVRLFHGGGWGWQRSWWRCQKRPPPASGANQRSRRPHVIS